MKWKKFKEFVESKGVNDETELAYEDMNFRGKDGLIDSFSITIDTEKNELRFKSKEFTFID